MEATMRLSLTLPLFAFAAALVLPPPASADWHKPYVYREGGSNWNTVQYDDGICRYYYSHNAYDDRTSLNKSGDCSHLAIGPDGMAVPVYGMAGPTVVAPPRYR